MRIRKPRYAKKVEGDIVIHTLDIPIRLRRKLVVIGFAVATRPREAKRG